ncbi:MAG TPA: class I SAM-dependent methyltransferase [Thermodesulfobacteriota bacterium]
MFDPYEEIFEKRGYLYHKAMTLYPQARREEFYNIIKMAQVRPGNIVCDIPSGGGYFKNFISTRVEIISIETSRTFAKLCKANTGMDVLLTNLDNLPIKNSTVDRVISLAGLHHIEDKQSFYLESYRIIKSGGILCIADAWQGSMVSMFLDVFVNENNSMGHRGTYLDENTKYELEKCGFNVSHSSSTKYYWRFKSLYDMVNYFQLLFGIDKASYEEILYGITQYLGYSQIKKEYCLNWELTFYRAVKP